MNIQAYKPLFGTWFEYFQDFLESKDFEKIILDLKNRASRGKIIFPYSSTLKQKCPDWINPKHNLFRAFELTDISKLNVIFLGDAPQSIIKNKVPVCDGLAFSTQQKELPYETNILYDGIEKDLYNGLNLNMERSPNLDFLAEQGVLLLNAALTCEPRMPTIHFDLWKPFMNYFFKKLNLEFSNLHIVLFGEDNFQFSKLIHEQKSESFPFPNQHYVYKEQLPSQNYKLMQKMDNNLFGIINTRLKQDSEKHIVTWDKVDLNPPF